MTTYSEKTLLTLLANSSDIDGDLVTVRRINGQVVQSWPHTVPLTHGQALVTQQGVVTYDDQNDTSGHPADGATTGNGSFTFTLWDGQDESPTYTATVQMTGVDQGGGPGPGPDPAAHAVVNTLSELTSLLSSWNSNWNGTASGLGLSTTDERYIDCNSGSYGTINLAARNFPQQVHIRATDRQGGAVFNGMSLTNVDRITFKYLKGSKTGGGDLINLAGGCSHITFSHCALEGTSTPGGTGGTFGVDIEGASGRHSHITVEYCTLERFGSNAIRLRQADDVTIRANVFNEAGSDDMQYKDAVNLLVENNWSSVMHHAPAAAHMDFIQFTKDHSTNKGVSNSTVRGNVCADWLFPNAGSKPFRQGMQLGDIGHTNILYEENVLMAGNTNGMNMAGGSTGCTIRNTTTIYMYDAGNTNGTRNTRIKANGNTVAGDYNLERRDNAPEVGANSVAYGYSTAAYAQYFGHLRQAGDAWTLLGVGGDASDLHPVPGSGAHWNDPNPVGAAGRLKEIFVDGLHPGNDGWPTASLWNAGHNQHGRISSTGGGTGGSVTVNDFPLDKFPYDTGAALGNGTAQVPLSGTGTPGATVEARPKQLGGAWTVIATVDQSGNWSGHLPVAEDGVYYNAEVRAQGAPASAVQTTNTFTTGHVGMMLSQSIFDRLSSSFHDQIAHPAVIDPDALLWLEIDHTVTPETASWLRITDSEPKATAAMKAVSNFLATHHPGRKFCLVDAMHAGSSVYQLVNDNNNSRKWSVLETTTVDLVRNTIGSPISYGQIHWYSSDHTVGDDWLYDMAPVYFGQRQNGTTYALGTQFSDAQTPVARVTIDHCFFDMDAAPDQRGRGLFAQNECRLRWIPPNPVINATALQSAEAKVGGGLASKPRNMRRIKQALKQFMADPRAQAVFLPLGAEPRNIKKGTGSPLTDTAHPAADDADGNMLVGEYLALNWLDAIGAINMTVPEITGVTWAVGGAYADVQIPVGVGNTLTTTRLKRGEPALPASPAHYSEVMGFEVNDVPVQAVIQNTGAASGTGIIRVYPNGGAFQNGNRMKFLWGGATGFLTQSDVNAGCYKNVPIVDYGLASLDGIPVRAVPDQAFMTASGI